MSAAEPLIAPRTGSPPLRLVPEPEEADEGLVDPRVEKQGGTRKDPKSNYDFPGMVDAASWRRTEVHKYTAWYG